MPDVATLKLTDWSEAAKALRGLTRDPGTTVLHLDGSGGLPAGGAHFVRQLDSVALPVVATVGGECDAAALAILAGATLGFVTDDLAVSVHAADVLALGLTSSLPAAIGAAPARSLLLSAALGAAALVRSGLARPAEDAIGMIHRLTDPTATSLVRSLRFAARSTPARAREFDAELRRIG